MEMTISFPGGKQVAASFAGFTVTADQPVADGGNGSAPSPYQYFLASIATCAGFYVLAFCQERGIPTDRVSLVQHPEFATTADGKRRLARVAITIGLPDDFPEKYRNAVVRAAEVCAVKKAILDPPLFEITTRVSD